MSNNLLSGHQGLCISRAVLHWVRPNKGKIRIARLQSKKITVRGTFVKVCCFSPKDKFRYFNFIGTDLFGKHKANSIAAAILEDAPAGTDPIFLLNLLAIFYDEAISAFERQWLLNGCLTHLRRLSRSVGVVVNVCTPRVANPENGVLLATLRASSAVVCLLTKSHQELISWTILTSFMNARSPGSVSQAR